MGEWDKTQTKPVESDATAGGALFGGGPAERSSFPATVWAVAALIVAVAAGGLALAGRKRSAGASNTLEPADPYAASLPLSQLAMSESTSLSGGKVTYLDGRIRDTGNRIISGVTVQVVFRNGEALPPQIDTQPLTLIRTREPYIDTEPVSAEPLKPGDEHEFRLIFETVPANWNTEMPEVRIIQTSTK